MRFEWYDDKAVANFRKHGVRFETAVRVFADPLIDTIQDRIENGEYRWQSVGFVGGFGLLLVAHVDREEGEIEVVRIISARQATVKEKRRYGQDRQI